jgi:hypothetical protein
MPHLCGGMQRMLAEGTEWKMPWLERVLVKRTDLLAPARAAFELDLREHFLRACVRRDLDAIAASHNIRDPVLHHDRKIGPLCPLPERGHGFRRIRTLQYRQ